MTMTGIFPHGNDQMYYMEILKGGTPTEGMLAMLFADLSAREMDTQRDFL